MLANYLIMKDSQVPEVKEKDIPAAFKPYEKEGQLIFPTRL